MNEVRELKEHVRWLEDEVGSVDHIEEQLDDIRGDVGGIHDRLDKIGDILESTVTQLGSMVGILQTGNDTLKKLVDALQGIGSALKEAGAKQQAAASQAEAVFSGTELAEFLNGQGKDRPKRPKRQKFKPKVVARDTNTDQPDADPPPAA